MNGPHRPFMKMTKIQNDKKHYGASGGNFFKHKGAKNKER